MTKMGFKKGRGPATKKTVKSETIAILERKFWPIFSEYIRRRDSLPDNPDYAACCSCGRVYPWRGMDAGHYISRSHKYVKYNEMNVHAQCKRCNKWLQGNATGYRQFLIKKYGEQVVLDLEASKDFKAGFTRDGLRLKIEEYKAKVKEMI
jgi:hypothetical protein